MKTLSITSLSALASLFLTTAAAAASAPSGVYLRNVNYAGTGCSAGSLSHRVHYRGGDLLLDFDDFVAEAGPGISLKEARKNCTISIDLRVPQGWSYSVQSATYRGQVRLDGGVSATQTTAYYFQGQARTEPLTSVFRGPTYRDFVVTDNLTSSLWSPCGVNRALNINIQAKVTGSRSRDGLISLDSPYNLSHNVHLAWRRCH